MPLPIRVVNNVIESPSLFAQTTQTVTFLLSAIIGERGQNYRNSVPTMQWGAGVVICPKRLCFNIFVIHIGILILVILDSKEIWYCAIAWMQDGKRGE